jgi:acyl-CoA hydrolase
MEGKTVKDSAIETVQIMTPQDVNLAGNIFGGALMKLIDSAAGAVAMRHVRGNAVTASMDRLDFLCPLYPGDLVKLKASLNHVGTTSMLIGVRVEKEGILSDKIEHAASAYLTFVALDNQGKPTRVPPLILETEEEKRRNREAIARRDQILQARREKKQNAAQA